MLSQALSPQPPGLSHGQGLTPKLQLYQAALILQPIDDLAAVAPIVLQPQVPDLQ